MAGQAVRLIGDQQAEVLNEASRTIRAETAIVPLYHEAALWTSRAGLCFAARADTLTYADAIRPR